MADEHALQADALAQRLEAQAEAMEQQRQDHVGVALALADCRQQVASSTAQARASALQREQLLLRWVGV